MTFDPSPPSAPHPNCIPGCVDEKDVTHDGSAPPGRRFTQAKLKQQGRAVRHNHKTTVAPDGITLDVEVIEGSDICPSETQSHAASSTEGVLYVHGGVSVTQQISPHLWCLKAKRWSLLHSTTNDAETARYGHTLTYLPESNSLVMLGGACADGAPQESVHTLSLDESTAWVLAGCSGEVTATMHHTAVLYGNHIIVFGGISQNSCLNQIQIFDTTNLRWLQSYTPQESSPEIPAPRSLHTAHIVSLGEEEGMLIFGGRLNGSPNSCTNDLFSYNLHGNFWSKVYAGGTIPPPRCGHASTSVRDQLLVYGGTCGETTYSDCFYLNILTSTWREVHLRGSLPGPLRHLTASVVQKGSLYMVLHGGAVRGVASHRTHLVTIGVSQRKRARPNTAPVPTSVPATAKSRGREEFNMTLNSPQRKASPVRPAEAPAWSVSTCHATTGREFGTAPDVPWRPFRHAVHSETVDSVVTRLADTRHIKETQNNLAEKYLFDPIKSRRLSVGGMDEFVHRMYHHQVELRDFYRRSLEEKHIPTRVPSRKRPEEILDMVTRLNAVPEKRDVGETLVQEPKKVDLKQSVDRLYYEGVESQKTHRKFLFERYSHKRETHRITSRKMQSMVTRLYNPPRGVLPTV